MNEKVAPRDNPPRTRTDTKTPTHATMGDGTPATTSPCMGPTDPVVPPSDALVPPRMASGGAVVGPLARRIPSLFVPLPNAP
jgi:hypothetical protein